MRRFCTQGLVKEKRSECWWGYVRGSNAAGFDLKAVA